MRQLSWAESIGLPIGVEGEYCEGICIEERNRATVFERFKDGIQMLLTIRDGYRYKNVDAVLFGVTNRGPETQYGVYVEPGFLIEISDDE